MEAVVNMVNIVNIEYFEYWILWKSWILNIVNIVNIVKIEYCEYCEYCDYWILWIGGGSGEVFDQDQEWGRGSKEPGFLHLDRFSSFCHKKVLLFWFSPLGQVFAFLQKKVNTILVFRLLDRFSIFSHVNCYYSGFHLCWAGFHLLAKKRVTILVFRQVFTFWHKKLFLSLWFSDVLDRLSFLA